VKPRTDLTHVGGLAEVDVDVGDLVVLEKSEDVLSRAVGSRSGGSVGGDANPDSDGTDDRVPSLAFFVVFVLDDFLETNDIDRCKTNLEILVSKLYKDCNNDNNSNDDNDGNDDNDSDDDDYDDSAAVAAAIARLLSLLPH